METDLDMLADIEEEHAEPVGRAEEHGDDADLLAEMEEHGEPLGRVEEEEGHDADLLGDMEQDYPDLLEDVEDDDQHAGGCDLLSGFEDDQNRTADSFDLLADMQDHSLQDQHGFQCAVNL